MALAPEQSRSSTRPPPTSRPGGGPPHREQCPGLCVPLREHYEALRAGDRHLADERDRRYAEVKAAEEKAIRVKEKADETALTLARDAASYREERDNRLREQIESERGLYATRTDLTAVADKHTSDVSTMMERFSSDIATLSDRFDAAHKPVVEFMAAQLARTGTITETRSEYRLNINTVLQALAVIVAGALVYAAFHK